MSGSIRSSVKDPKSGKMVYKSVALNRFKTSEEAKQYMKDWRESIKKGDTIPEDTIPDATPITDAKQAEAIIMNIPADFTKDLKMNINYKTGNTFLLLGSSKAGKTNLLKYIYDTYYKSEKNFISFLFAENVHDRTYNSVNNKVIKTHIFNPTIIKVIHKLQRGSKNKYNFLVMFDDIVQESAKNNETVKKLITSYRNAKISSIISVQAPKMVSRTNRGNLNYVTFHAFRNDEHIEDAIDMFLGSRYPFKGLKKEEKISLYRKLTDDHHFLFLDTINNIFYRSKIGLIR